MDVAAIIALILTIGAIGGVVICRLQRAFNSALDNGFNDFCDVDGIDGGDPFPGTVLSNRFHAERNNDGTL